MSEGPASLRLQKRPRPYARAGVASLLERPEVTAPPLSAIRRFELRMHALCTASRMLPALTADNAASERARLISILESGGMPVPDWRLPPRRVPGSAFRLTDELRAEARDLPGQELYADKLDELELDLLMLDALGRPRAVRPLAARRYGTGATLAPTAQGMIPLAQCARSILDRVAPSSEPREVAAAGGDDSLAGMVQACAAAAGLEVCVRVEPRLSAGAATGERTVFVAARKFGRNEARRLAVHEVFGHLLSAANGRAQTLRLMQWGTAGSFVDQEGVALYMEEVAGVLDGARLRTLAGRVIAADMMHAGATFADTARKLLRDEGFSPADAIAIAERAYRGGGVARDVAYLLGWLRVHHALREGQATLDELRCGRISLSALPALRALAQDGYARGPAFRPVLPNFSRNFFSTSSGTTPLRSPPSDAASLMRLELTKK